MFFFYIACLFNCCCDWCYIYELSCALEKRTKATRISISLHFFLRRAIITPTYIAGRIFTFPVQYFIFVFSINKTSRFIGIWMYISISHASCERNEFNAVLSIGSLHSEHSRRCMCVYVEMDCIQEYMDARSDAQHVHCRSCVMCYIVERL